MGEATAVRRQAEAPTVSITYAGQKYRVRMSHPANDEIPLHLGPESDFADLVASMRRRGFDPDRKVTVQSSSGLVISGRRRELAAAVAGVKPLYRSLGLSDSEVVQFVYIEDLCRRQLRPAERAAAVLKLNEMVKAAGGRRQTKASAAKSVGVSERTLRYVAAKIRRAATLPVAADSDPLRDAVKKLAAVTRALVAWRDTAAGGRVDVREAMRHIQAATGLLSAALGEIEGEPAGKCSREPA